MPNRRSVLLGLSIMAVGPVLVACGDDGSTGSSGSGSTGSSGSGGSGSSGTPAADAFPVTIAHKYGDTTVEKAPTRVVCVGLTEQDALLAVGVIPVAVTEWFGDAPGFIFPWATAAFDAAGGGDLPGVLPSTDGIDVEKVASYAPDLIIGQYAGITEKEYALLSKIAPTVAQSGDYADYGAPWDEMSINIGKAVGRADQMQVVIDDVKQQIVDAAAANPQFKGKSAVCITGYEGLFIYGPEDPRSRMLVDLGFVFPDGVFGESGEEFGESVSSEQTSELDGVDLAVWLDLEADPVTKGIFDETSTAKEGRFVDIAEDDGAYYVGHSFVTPLSIPYVLERYLPQLAAAVDGDPATVPPEAAA